MNRLIATLTLWGTVLAAVIMLAGLLWFLPAHWHAPAGDHIFTGEPKFFTNPVAMVAHVFDLGAVGERRSLIMLGLGLLLLNPVVRVLLAAIGYARSGDPAFAAVSLLVFGILMVSFFW